MRTGVPMGPHPLPCGQGLPPEISAHAPVPSASLQTRRQCAADARLRGLPRRTNDGPMGVWSFQFPPEAPADGKDRAVVLSIEKTGKARHPPPPPPPPEFVRTSRGGGGGSGGGGGGGDGMVQRDGVGDGRARRGRRRRHSTGRTRRPRHSTGPQRRSRHSTSLQRRRAAPSPPTASRPPLSRKGIRKTPRRAGGYLSDPRGGRGRRDTRVHRPPRRGGRSDRVGGCL